MMQVMIKTQNIASVQCSSLAKCSVDTMTVVRKKDVRLIASPCAGFWI